MNTHERIVAAAAELTTESGWAAITMAKLADRVGVSRQTVYNEIGSKPRLAEEMILNELAAFLGEVDRAFDAHPDDLVAAIRGARKGVAATALEHASAMAVNAKGDVTIALDEANPIYEQALDAVKSELATLLRQWFGGVERVVVRPAEGTAAPPTRLTDAMVRTERLSALRRRDPVLGAAIDALDLDLAD